MILTLLQCTTQSPKPPTPSKDVWRVRVGRGEEDGVTADLLPASLLAPDIEAMRLYPFDEFVNLVEALGGTFSEEPVEHAAWTTLPVSVACPQGEKAELVAIRSREAAAGAVREWISYARGAFPAAASLCVRVE